MKERTLPERFGSMVEALTRLSARLGMLLLIGAVLATIADILARKLAGYTYSATIDVVQLLVLAAADLRSPYAIAIRSHVAVDVLANPLGIRGRALTDLLTACLGTLLLTSFAWFGGEQASLQHSYGDASQTVGIPMIWYWLPLLYGCVLSALMCGVLAVRAARTLVS